MSEERFHIAEWYGLPFHKMSDADRVECASHKVGNATMTQAEIDRLQTLEATSASGTLTVRQSERLATLRSKLETQQIKEKPCPFKAGKTHGVCTKKGGVCSIRVYEDRGGTPTPINGPRGRIRALCPWRFHQDNAAFREVGNRLLGSSNPTQAGEVGFLESTGNLDSDPGEDVGRIDMILVDTSQPPNTPLRWVAVEVQAVYFSGKKMGLEFQHLLQTDGKLSVAREKRRPDYRSSGVKRLMPQLQTKVPTLRRWGKKMAVIVDAPFFYSMGAMTKETDISNADIVWVLVDFVEEPGQAGYHLRVVEEIYTTLESATLGLTGGTPLSQSQFEDRIRTKIEK